MGHKLKHIIHAGAGRARVTLGSSAPGQLLSDTAAMHLLRSAPPVPVHRPPLPKAGTPGSSGAPSQVCMPARADNPYISPSIAQRGFAPSLKPPISPCASSATAQVHDTRLIRCTLLGVHARLGGQPIKRSHLLLNRQAPIK